MLKSIKQDHVPGTIIALHAIVNIIKSENHEANQIRMDLKHRFKRPSWSQYRFKGKHNA